MTDSANKPGAPRLAATIGGGAWTVAERVIAQVSQLVIFITAARILSPAEFGVFSLVSACAILLLRTSEAGWAPYIMSWQGDDTVPRQVLMIAILSGLGAGGLAALSGLAALFLGFGQEVANLLFLFAAWVVMANVSSTQKGMMIWSDSLRGSAVAESAGEILGMAVAVVSLYFGDGIYALVFGRLTFQFTHLSLSFIFTRKTPLFGMKRAEVRTLLVYSAHIFSSRFIVNLRFYLATFIIGGFLGPASVGYYRAAQRVVDSVAEIIDVPSIVLAWSMFRQARDEHGIRSDGFQRQINIFFKLLFGIGIPVLIWLALMGGDLVYGLLGSKWLPALPLLAILALARAIALPNVAVEPILSMNGEMRRLPKFSMGVLMLSGVATTIGAMTGIMAVAWAQVLVAIGSAFVFQMLLRRHGGLKLTQIFSAARPLVIPIILGTVTILVARNTVPFEALPPLLRAIGVALPACVVYLISLSITDPVLKGYLSTRFLRTRQT